MNGNRVTTTILSALLLSAAGCSHSGSTSQQGSGGAITNDEGDGAKDNDEKSEVIIKFSEAPDAVKAAARKLTSEANITRVIRESDEGITTYEIEYTDAGTKWAAIISASGDVMETERTVATGSLPAAAAAAIRKEMPSANIGTVQVVTKTYYEVEITESGKKREIKVDAAGNIDDGGDEKSEQEGTK